MGLLIKFDDEDERFLEDQEFIEWRDERRQVEAAKLDPAAQNTNNTKE